MDGDTHAVTLYRIDHAVVMDTDDIPGRGGYALVGVSHEVTQAERAFVAQNFGISDYLHDPQLQNPDEHRIFYSFFRVPGGRRALVRRFAKGVRRNQTQNRLFVHTLFIDDDLYERMHGLPWLLVNANVRAEGMTEWGRLRDEIPWTEEAGWIPRLEWNDGDNAADDVSDSLRKRIALLGKQLGGDARAGADAVANVITTLSRERRMLLPQGRGYELLTMLAWSMLPWLDREEIAWTQHDPMNISGVRFDLANVPEIKAESIGLGARPSSFALDIVGKSASEETWRDFQDRAKNASQPLTVRNPAVITRWLEWRKGVEALVANFGGDAMTALAAVARNQEDAPWIDREEILQLFWEKIRDETGVATWAARLTASGLDQVLFRAAPERRWLDHAREQANANLLVSFFLAAAGEKPSNAPARGAVAAWVADTALAGISTERLAELAVRVAADRGRASAALLEHLVATDAGLVALTRKARPEEPELVFAATPIVVRKPREHAREFLRDVLVQHLELVPSSRARVTAELARGVAGVLRAYPDDFVAFALRVPPEIQDELTDLTSKWLFADEKLTPLGREVLSRFGSRGSYAAPLAIALASAGEPAHSWFRVLLQVAGSIDAAADAKTASFLQTIEQLGRRPLKLGGAMQSMLQWLDESLELRRRPGDCVRALILLLRPGWKSRGDDLLKVLFELLRDSSFVSGWEPLICAVARDFASSHARPVSAFVAMYWMKTTEPSLVPSLDRGIIEALSDLNEKDRKTVAAAWEGLMRHIPPGPAFDLLYNQLYGEGAASGPRIQRAWRAIEQEIADDGTLNELDAALFAKEGKGYEREMARAIDRYVEGAGAARRVQRLCALLVASEVHPTVKRVIEVHVLPRAVVRLKVSDWRSAFSIMKEKELLGRGVARLTLARAIGLAADEHTLGGFESLCRAGGHVDALKALTGGRRDSGVFRKVARTIGF